MIFKKMFSIYKWKPIKSASMVFSIILLSSIFFQPGCSTISAGLETASKFIDPKAVKDGVDKLNKDGEEKEEEPADKKEPQKLRIGFIPFDFSFETGASSADDAVQALSASMIGRKTFKPFSLRTWLGEEVNKVTAVNIQQIMDRAKATDIKIDSICYGRIFKSGSDYGLYVELYPLIPGIPPSYYFRSFSNYSSLGKVAEDIVAEIENRGHVPKKPLFDINIYIKSFNLNFYTYTDLRKGEGSIIQIPYLNVEGTSYKTDDVFFSSILLYNMHSTRLFSVWNNNVKHYIQKSPVIPSNMDVIIEIDLDVSSNVNMLTVRVTDRRKKNSPAFKYQYPFSTLNIENINNVFRENVKIIVMHLLSDEEKKRFGVVNLESIGRQKPVFCDGFFLGYGRQYNLLFPSGSSDLDVDGKKYKIFVSPFTVNNQIYDIRDSFLLDLKK